MIYITIKHGGCYFGIGIFQGNGDKGHIDLTGMSQRVGKAGILPKWCYFPYLFLSLFQFSELCVLLFLGTVHSLSLPVVL